MVSQQPISSSNSGRGKLDDPKPLQPDVAEALEAIKVGAGAPTPQPAARTRKKPTVCDPRCSASFCLKGLIVISVTAEVPSTIRNWTVSG